LKGLSFHKTEKMVTFMKWSGLQKSVSKFRPKIFYEIGPRWKTFIANFGITVPSTIKNVTLGKKYPIVQKI